MKTRLLIASGVCLAAFAALSVPAGAKTMKECAAQWQEMKAANQTNGDEISRLQQAVHVGGRPSGGRDPAAAGGGEAAPTPATAPRPARKSRVRRTCGRVCARARLRRRVEGRKGGGKDAPRTEVAAILERVQQAQEGGRDVTGGLRLAANDGPPAAACGDHFSLRSAAVALGRTRRERSSRHANQRWWAVQGSNLRPLPCQGSALPLS